MKKDKVHDGEKPMPMAKDSKKSDHDKDYGPEYVMGDKAMMDKNMKKKMAAGYFPHPKYGKQMQRQYGNARMGRMLMEIEDEESGDSPAEVPTELPAERSQDTGNDN